MIDDFGPLVVIRIETNLYEPKKKGIVSVAVCRKLAAPEDDLLEIETCSAI
jgi:hypothetical protein